MGKLLAFLLIFLPMTSMEALAQTAPGTVHFPISSRIIRDAVEREPVPVAASWRASRQARPHDRSWPGRHPVLFGALVGTGAGVLIETAVIPGASGGEPHRVYLPMFAGMGAGTGALVGLIVSAARR